MLKKLLIVLSVCCIIFNSMQVSAKGIKYVEIFDPKQNKVVKTVQLNAEIQNMVTSWISNINGMYDKNDPITDDGYVIKVPVEPAVTIHSKWLNSTVSEVYIAIPEKESPSYMIFENKNRLICYAFNGDISMLEKSLNFKLGKAS